MVRHMMTWHGGAGRGHLEATDSIDSTSGVLFKDQVQLMLPRLALQNKYSALHSAAQLKTQTHMQLTHHVRQFGHALCAPTVCKCWLMRKLVQQAASAACNQ